MAVPSPVTEEPSATPRRGATGGTAHLRAVPSETPQPWRPMGKRKNEAEPFWLPFSGAAIYRFCLSERWCSDKTGRNDVSEGGVFSAFNRVSQANAPSDEPFRAVVRVGPRNTSSAYIHQLEKLSPEILLSSLSEHYRYVQGNTVPPWSATCSVSLKGGLVNTAYECSTSRAPLSGHGRRLQLSLLSLHRCSAKPLNPVTALTPEQSTPQ